MEQSILLIEDTPFYGLLVLAFLSRNGHYQTRWAQTGGQALLLAKESVPLLFLLDYRLPDMTGIALYDQLHTLDGRERVPALLLSADFPNKELEERLALRGIGGMSKVFTTEALLLSIERLIKQ